MGGNGIIHRQGRRELPTNQNLDNLLKQHIALSPLAWPLAYQYPVQKISPAFLPDEAPEQPTFLIVYRNQDDDVNFIEITPITYRLLELIQENEQLLTEDCLKQVARRIESSRPGNDYCRRLADSKRIGRKDDHYSCCLNQEGPALPLIILYGRPVCWIKRNCVDQHGLL